MKQSELKLSTLVRRVAWACLEPALHQQTGSGLVQDGRNVVDVATKAWLLVSEVYPDPEHDLSDEEVRGLLKTAWVLTPRREE